MKHLLLGTAAVAAALAFAAPDAARAAQLKANHYLPSKHPIAVGYDTFAKVVKEKTGGDVTVRVFPGGSLLGAKATMDGLKDGVVDVGFIVNTYYPAQFPHGRLMNDLSMVGDDSYAASFAITELYTFNCSACLAEYAKVNEVYLGTASTPPYVMISGGDKINSLEGLRGKKMRAGGDLWDRWAEFVGGIGVNIPSAEMFEGLSRGILDLAIYAVGGLKTHGLADVAGSVVMLPLGTFRSDNLFAFNMEKWAELSEAQRTAVLHAVAAGVVDADVAYVKGDQEGIALGKKEGIPILEPAPELVEAREKFIEQDVAQTIERATQEYGIKDPAKFVADYKRLYAKYADLVKPIHDDREKLVELLWNEVFSKIDVTKYGMGKTG